MVWVRMVRDRRTPGATHMPPRAQNPRICHASTYDTEPTGFSGRSGMFHYTLERFVTTILVRARRLVLFEGGHLMTVGRHGLRGLALLWLAITAGCTRDDRRCDGCETLVVAAVGEPSTLIPPLVSETVGRDIGDQVFERLADLRPGAASIDSAAYEPA